MLILPVLPMLPADIKGKTKLIYTVQDGDNLGFISEWYKVGLSISGTGIIFTVIL